MGFIEKIPQDETQNLVTHRIHGIFTYIYHKNQPNVGYGLFCYFERFNCEEVRVQDRASYKEDLPRPNKNTSAAVFNGL